MLHRSPYVQASPSLQSVPSGAFGVEQKPVLGSQLPAVWHWSEAEHVTGFVPMQAPAWQVSDWVQASPSLQPVPLLAFGLEQVPLNGSQVPAVWHWS